MLDGCDGCLHQLPFSGQGLGGHVDALATELLKGRFPLKGDLSRGSGYFDGYFEPYPAHILSYPKLLQT